MDETSAMLVVADRAQEFERGLLVDVPGQTLYPR
jgi:hypothetical protein